VVGNRTGIIASVLKSSHMIIADDDLVPRAAQFARKVHDGMGFVSVGGHDRPQIEHLQEVADLVWVSGGSEIEIAAAWLHDSVEDTSATLEGIEKLFGKDVAKLVHELTDAEELKYLPTAERKQIQANRIRNESESARRIKMADQTSNVRRVTIDPKDGWTVDGRRNYVIGAYKIAEQCKGLNAILDAAFNREYARAQHILEITDDTTQTLETLDKDLLI
jgi:guanosine-3',5'-bis(diphosphate) 3'-pyrophosphohydrolase